MKAPAPDKIYIPNLIDTVSRIILTTTTAPDDIEYIRKDSLWKPSEEQMIALNKVVNGEVLLTTQHKSLELLYEDLKKL